MQAVRGEVHRVARDAWVDWINRELPERGLSRVLLGHGPVAERFAAGATDAFRIRRYDRPIEEWKQALFRDVDFAITGSRGGLAESGSLVLWPDAEEPRLMSLVPPLHLALLDADRLFENFAAMIEQERWARRHADECAADLWAFEDRRHRADLAYGIHGPKQLITLILD